MYSERISLSVNDLLEYEFKIDARGYRPQEVDKVLDAVIRDETEYLNIIKKYEKHVEEQNNHILALKQELRKLRDELDNTNSNVEEKSPSNIDLLKRLSQLEKIVYSKF